jgi:hypothetical protein
VGSCSLPLSFLPLFIFSPHFPFLLDGLVMCCAAVDLSLSSHEREGMERTTF